MKVILYYPPVTPQTAFPTWEPLQLLFLVRMLRKHNIEAEIIDGRIIKEEARKEKLRNAIDSTAICLGITCLTCYQIIDALEVAEYVKKIYPQLPIILGGWHPTITPEETLKEFKVDIVIRGQGEITFLEVLDRLLGDKNLKGIKGISWKKNDSIIHEKDRQLISPDQLPPLLPTDFERLHLDYYQIHDVLYYMSSVGCPYSCNYCCVSVPSKRRWLALSSKNVVDELGRLYSRFGFKKVIFWDNVFFVDKRRVVNICEEFIDKRFKFSWSAHGRINEIMTWSDDFVKLLKVSGCETIFIGVESGSQKILDKIKKGISARDIIPSLSKLKKHDINVVVNYMVGIPGEDYRDVKKTIMSIRDGLGLYGYNLEAFNAQIYRFVALPGTAIFNALALEELEKLPKSAIEWGKFVHETIDDAMQPWKECNDKSLFASSTFYLWKGYLDQSKPKSLKGKLLRKMCKFRVNNGFLKLPVEWYMWKKQRNM